MGVSPYFKEGSRREKGAGTNETAEKLTLREDYGQGFPVIVD
jgi:hypothetical protein